ncbi:MAG: hypothetical protein JWM33_615 [Caulobacteraceae bacterium]|nr:hypothetical protein [Caulobacteraceae bacterium]
MDAEHVARLLLRLTLLASAAIVVVIVLRAPVRRLAGARLAYGLWLLVPLVMAAAFAPAPPAGWSLFPSSARPAISAPVALPDMSQILVPAAPVASVAPAKPVRPPIKPGLLWVSLWAAGLTGFTVRLIWLQVRFASQLGRLSPDPVLLGVFHSPREDAGPAVVGLLRSRIILPAGFPATYEPEEQALIVAHERVHLHDRHPLASAGALTLLALQWFNPLAHFALRLFRVDQELACDAAVIAAHPDKRAIYARAMLKAGSQGLAAGPLSVR